MKNDIEIKRSSGNVFADLCFPNPDEALAKAEIAKKIGSIIKGRKLTQVAAGQLLGIDQPKVSALMRGRLSGFSLDRLFRYLNILGSDVEIVIKEKPASQSEAHTCVVCS